jgi:hypothetical protein
MIPVALSARLCFPGASCFTSKRSTSRTLQRVKQEITGPCTSKSLFEEVSLHVCNMVYLLSCGCLIYSRVHVIEIRDLSSHFEGHAHTLRMEQEMPFEKDRDETHGCSVFKLGCASFASPCICPYRSTPSQRHWHPVRPVDQDQLMPCNNYTGCTNSSSIPLSSFLLILLATLTTGQAECEVLLCVCVTEIGSNSIVTLGSS